MAHNSLPVACNEVEDFTSNSYNVSMVMLYREQASSSPAMSLSISTSDCEVLACNWTVQRAAGNLHLMMKGGLLK